jgi:hypothetical protein
VQFEGANLNVKKVFAIEITSIAIIIALVLVFVEVTPFLVSSQQESIGVYNEKEFAHGTLTLVQGQSASAQFNYSTYDPAILVIDLLFQDWQVQGFLSLYCNGRLIVTIHATPNNPIVHFTTISVSGWDWVKPPSLNTATYGNEVTFDSDPTNGYSGSFSYKIDIRGSR